MRKAHPSQIKQYDIMHLQSENFFGDSKEFERFISIGICPDSCDIRVISVEKRIVWNQVLYRIVGLMDLGRKTLDGLPIFQEVHFSLSGAHKVYITGSCEDCEQALAIISHENSELDSEDDEDITEGPETYDLKDILKSLESLMGWDPDLDDLQSDFEEGEGEEE